MKYFKRRLETKTELFAANPKDYLIKGLCIQRTDSFQTYYVCVLIFLSMGTDWQEITKEEFDSEYDNAINSFMPFLS
jgi:hypothetical protein